MSGYRSGAAPSRKPDKGFAEISEDSWLKKARSEMLLPQEDGGRKTEDGPRASDIRLRTSDIRLRTSDIRLLTSDFGPPTSGET